MSFEDLVEGPCSARTMVQRFYCLETKAWTFLHIKETYDAALVRELGETLSKISVQDQGVSISVTAIRKLFLPRHICEHLRKRKSLVNGNLPYAVVYCSRVCAVCLVGGL
jgi:hypothetical protein